MVAIFSSLEAFFSKTDHLLIFSSASEALYLWNQKDINWNFQVFSKRIVFRATVSLDWNNKRYWLIFFHGTVDMGGTRRVSLVHGASSLIFFPPIRKYPSGRSFPLFKRRDGKRPRVTSWIEARWPGGDVARSSIFPGTSDFSTRPPISTPTKESGNRRAGLVFQEHVGWLLRHRFPGPSMLLGEYSIVQDSFSAANQFIPLFYKFRRKFPQRRLCTVVKTYAASDISGWKS